MPTVVWSINKKKENNQKTKQIERLLSNRIYRRIIKKVINYFKSFRQALLIEVILLIVTSRISNYISVERSFSFILKLLISNLCILLIANKAMTESCSVANSC